MICQIQTSLGTVSDALMLLEMIIQEEKLCNRGKGRFAWLTDVAGTVPQERKTRKREFVTFDIGSLGKGRHYDTGKDWK